MNILGIDPGLQKTGWGIVTVNGNALRYVASGLIKTDPKQGLCKRLATLHFGLVAVVDQYKPQLCAIEETFVNNNPHSTLKLGQARGVLMAAAAIKGLTVGEYSANKVKKSVVGSGHAAKQQIGLMVKTLLPSCGTLGEDEADALAVAITHAHYSSIEILNRKNSA